MMAGGFLVSGDREDQIQLDLEFHNPVALLDLLVAERDGNLITLRDVARVVDGTDDRRRLARFDGEASVGLGIVKVPGANTVAIAEEIRNRVEERIIPSLPPGLELSIAYDESNFILEQIDGLFLTIALGVFLTALVIWFLKSFRSTLIVSLSIPISLMAAIAIIYFFATRCSVTMLAMLLLIGVVVDDDRSAGEHLSPSAERGTRVRGMRRSPEPGGLSGGDRHDLCIGFDLCLGPLP